MQRHKINPVEQAIITQGLIACAREMGAKLIRSAYSTILREARDGSAAILDREGNVIAQADLIPLQLGSIGETFKPCAALMPLSNLKEGDFYINNSPFSGGQHLPDVYIFSPIFVDGELIGFSASVAHHIDLGGGAPGMNPNATDIHQEGLIIPPSCYNLDRDWNGGPFERLITANIRVPELTIGDFNAQFAANAVGAERLNQLCTRYGNDVILSVMEAHLNYTEQRMRSAISRIPDGVYFGEDAIDDDGITNIPLPIKATVAVSGDSISVDFEGTAPQIILNLNCPFTSTISSVLAAIKSVVTTTDLPFNDGLIRPIKVKAPYGSILNPKPPVPVRARSVAASRTFDAVMKALSQAVPDKVIATGFGTPYSLCLSKLTKETFNIYIEIFGGGYGAGGDNNGCDGVDGPMSNCSNIPIEALDQKYKFFRVTEYTMRDGSGGWGRRKGGDGLRRKYEILENDVMLAHYSDRYKLESDGAFGGESGISARTRIFRADGEEVELGSKASLTLHKGDILVGETGGGGGYGSPR